MTREEVKLHNGTMLITFPEWGELDYFEKTLQGTGLAWQVIDTRTSGDGQRVYRLYAIKKGASVHEACFRG